MTRVIPASFLLAVLAGVAHAAAPTPGPPLTIQRARAHTRLEAMRAVK